LTNAFSKKLDNHKSSRRNPFHGLQLLPHPPDLARHPGNGGWHCRPRLELGGNCEFVKSGFVKSRIAKISLVVAVALFFLGLFMLCACPGWYAMAAVFAGVAVWGSIGRRRLWAIIWLVACLIATIFQTIAAIHERRSFIEKAERAQRIDVMRTRGTNTLQQTNAVPK
jgi:uncharacterized membrane protein